MTTTPTPSVEEMCAEALALDEKALRAATDELIRQNEPGAYADQMDDLRESFRPDAEKVIRAYVSIAHSDLACLLLSTSARLKVAEEALDKMQGAHATTCGHLFVAERALEQADAALLDVGHAITHKMAATTSKAHTAASIRRAARDLASRDTPAPQAAPEASPAKPVPKPTQDKDQQA